MNTVLFQGLPQFALVFEKHEVRLYQRNQINNVKILAKVNNFKSREIIPKNGIHSQKWKYNQPQSGEELIKQHIL